MSGLAEGETLSACDDVQENDDVRRHAKVRFLKD